MKLSTSIHQHFRKAALGGLLLAAGTASAISLTSKHTGSWFNPNQDGQGFAIEVVPGATANEKQAVVYWYTFDANGNPTWFFGAGPIQGNKADVTLYSAQGGTMGQAGQADKQEWGSMQLDFSSCDHGDVSYQSAQASGSFTIERITTVLGDVCTGTLVDDVSDDQTAPEHIMQELYAAAGQGRGMTELEVGPSLSSFNVKVYDLPEGSYDLLVDGEVHGQLQVIQEENTTRGELEFVSPASPNKPLLDFDPRGKTIDIAQAGQTLLSTTVAETADPSTEPTTGNPPAFGNSEAEVRLQRTSTDPAFADAYAKAQLEQKSDRVEFDVKLENAPAGAYELYVGGELRGAIEVVDLGSVSEGKIRFHYPAVAGYELLDFDPQGATIEIMDAAGTIFTGDLTTAGSTDNSDGSNPEHNGDSNGGDNDQDGDTNGDSDNDQVGNGGSDHSGDSNGGDNDQDGDTNGDSDNDQVGNGGSDHSGDSNGGDNDQDGDTNGDSDNDQDGNGDSDHSGDSNGGDNDQDGDTNGDSDNDQDGNGDDNGNGDSDCTSMNCGG